MTNSNGEPAFKPGPRVWIYRGFLAAVILGTAALGWYASRLAGSTLAATALPSSSPLATSRPSATAAPLTQPALVSETAEPREPIVGQEGTLVFSARRDGRTHLWAYIIGDPSPRQITFGEWDDRDPAIDPLGERIAFASNRRGYWDLYLLDLGSGEVRALTETPGYEGHPTWSPDGRWIAYEAYESGDFDIWILPVSLDQEPIRLTNHPANDLSPAWDPNGRRIAFVSERDGGRDIFLADLDRPDDRFQNLTHTAELEEGDPAFSPDGSRLAYVQYGFGFPQITTAPLDGEIQPTVRGQGRKPAWSPQGEVLAAILDSPHDSQIVSYVADGAHARRIGFPVILDLGHIDWTPFDLRQPVMQLAASEQAAVPLYEVATDAPAGPGGRITLKALPGVEAPNPMLSDAVDEAFLALRERALRELGWDFLSTLDFAFAGINDPLPPGLTYRDWLYTGRAFAFSLSAVQAGWIEVVREDFGGQTYWRVYVRAAEQDGSLGEPLRDHPWDFEARFEGDSQAYDQGGLEKTRIPLGYYVDFTRLAADYGFERLPALPNWRTYYHGARFHEFVHRDGLDWESAMLELYPPSALITPTPFQTPTPTPTRTLRPTPTPWWWRWLTPTATSTPTPQPSITPSPAP